MPSTPGVTRKRAVGTELTEGGPDEIRLVYREKVADRGKLWDFAERAWRLFPKKGSEYMDCPTSDEQDHLIGHRNSPVASQWAQENLTLGTHPSTRTLPESINDDGDFERDGDIYRMFTERVGLQ